MPAHGAVEFVAGFAMMIAPVILSFGFAGLVVSASLGAVLSGMGLGLATSPRDRVFAWHVHFDSLFVLITAIAALGLAIAGDARPGLFLAVLVCLQAALNTATRYVAAG
jgi:hypothetical protein